MSIDADNKSSIFISYAHEDREWKEELLDHLGALTNMHQVDVFSDEQIVVGDEWDPLIRKKLDRADIIVLMISAKFLRSRYCTQTELKIAMERHGAGAATIVPIVVSECDWPALPISKLQCLPKDERQDLKALKDWGRKKEHALKAIAAQIRHVVQTARSTDDIDVGRYADAVRRRWDVLDLTVLTQPGADDPSKPRPRLSQLFTPQQARRSRPPVSLPREYLARHGFDPDAETTRLDVLRQSWESTQREPALELLAHVDARWAVILGDPGAGKSSLARWLVLQLLDPPADDAPAWRAALGQRLPLLIELRDYISRAADKGCQSFLDYLAYLAEHQGLGFPRSQTDALLRRSDSFVIFDGLDEIFDPPTRRRITQEIIGFARRFDRARILVTSRIAGFDAHLFESHEFLIATLDDLDRRQIENFAEVWFDLDFAGQPKEAERARRDLLDTLTERPALMALAGNPLLLTLMAIVARHERLARSRVGLYRQALKVLCYSWDLRRELDLPADSPLKDLGPEDKHRLLQKVAWRMQEAGTGLRANAIEEADLQAAVNDHFAIEWPVLDGPKRGAAVRDMIQLLEVRNWMLTLRGPALYGFVHRTFLEHLCATELRERWEQREIDTDELIAQYVMAHADDDSWHEVIRLLSAQLPVKATEPLLQALLPTTATAYAEAERLALAVQCIAEQEPKRLALLDVPCSSALKATYAWLADGSTKYFDRDRKTADALASAFRQVGPFWPNTESTANVLGFPTSNNYNIGFISTVKTLYTQIFCKNLGLREMLRYEAEMNADADIWGARVAAIEAFADRFVDEPATRPFLLTRAEHDPDASPRDTALKLLASHYGDDPAIRIFLLTRAEHDPDASPRRMALKLLASHYGDDPAIRIFLLARAEHDPEAGPRHTALEALAQGYFDDPATRPFLLARAEQDPDARPRGTALEALADWYFDDPATRPFLLARAEHDPDANPRGTALRLLARHYHNDPPTKPFLLTRAKHDPGAGPRGVALRLLAFHYRYDPAIKPLVLAAADAKDEATRQGAALAWGHFVDERLKLQLLSRDLDGLEPGYDPRHMVDQDRLNAAVRHLAKPKAEIRQAYEEIAATFPLRLAWLSGAKSLRSLTACPKR